MSESPNSAVSSQHSSTLDPSELSKIKPSVFPGSVGKRHGSKKRREEKVQRKQKKKICAFT